MPEPMPRPMPRLGPRPGPRHRLRACVAVALLGILVACGGGQDSSPREPAESESEQAAADLAKGTCWEDQQLPATLGEDEFEKWVEKYAGGDSALGGAMRDDAAFTNEVDCAEPHALEVYNIVEVAPELEERVEQYADLLDQDSALYRRIRDQVNDRCVDGSPYAAAMGKLPVQLGPSLNPDSGLHLAWDPYPAERWEKGEHKFVCTFEQDEPGTLRFADLTTRKVPVAARVCLNVPGKFVPCRGPHQAEDIGHLVLNTAIEQGQVNARRAISKGPDGRQVAFTDAEYDRLDKVCQSLLTRVSRDRGDTTAKVFPGSVKQWPTPDGAYVASCFALEDFDPPPKVRGTVFNKG